MWRVLGDRRCAAETWLNKQLASGEQRPPPLNTILLESATARADKTRGRTALGIRC